LGQLANAWGNGPVEGSVVWHPHSEIVAAAMLLNRKEGDLWVWRHLSGLRRLGADAVEAMRIPAPEIYPGGGIFATVKSWNGDELQFEMFVGTRRDNVYAVQTALISWNAKTDSLQVLSKKSQTN
jgi:hypothetical protein